MVQLQWQVVGQVTKVNNKMEWPLLSKEVDQQFKQGLYQLIYNGEVIKNGCFGEGLAKGIKSRMGQYRSASNRLDEMRAGTASKNGSYLTNDYLQTRLKEGDTVILQAVALPDNVVDENGFPWKVDLYALENQLKELHKDTIWLI